MHRTTLDYTKHCRFALGQYVQAHEDNDPSNTQAPRTRDALYLRPIPNGHEVYMLDTREVVNRRNLTAQPITPSVIALVNSIAEKDKMKAYVWLVLMAKFSMIPPGQKEWIMTIAKKIQILTVIMSLMTTMTAVMMTVYQS